MYRRILLLEYTSVSWSDRQRVTENLSTTYMSCLAIVGNFFEGSPTAWEGNLLRSPLPPSASPSRLQQIAHYIPSPQNCQYTWSTSYHGPSFRPFFPIFSKTKLITHTVMIHTSNMVSVGGLPQTQGLGWLAVSASLV